MSLISLLVTLIVIGMLLWAANSVIPMEPTIKRIVNVVVVVAVCLWLLSAFGLLAGFPNPRIGR
jgi:type IV secretory pathway TrbL component